MIVPPLHRIHALRLTSRHLRWAKETTESEEATRARLLSRLPTDIVDMHTHAAQNAAVGALSEYAWSQSRSSFPVWTLRHSRNVTALLYGDRAVTRLRMGHPFRGMRHAQINEYLVRRATPRDQVILCGRPDDETYTRSELERGVYVGLKLYPHYREPPYDFIREFFPEWSMRAAAEADVPIILHVRRPPSIAWQEIAEFADAYPQNRIVLAHLARETAPSPNAEVGFTSLSERENLATDISMAVDQDIMQIALATFGPDRVMYGSDEPFNLLRFRAIWDGSQRRRAPARPYNWFSKSDYEALSPRGAGAALVHWQVLENLIAAVDRAWPDSTEAVLRQIFRDNALAWFTGVQRPNR